MLEHGFVRGVFDGVRAGSSASSASNVVINASESSRDVAVRALRGTAPVQKVREHRKKTSTRARTRLYHKVSRTRTESSMRFSRITRGRGVPGLAGLHSTRLGRSARECSRCRGESEAAVFHLRHRAFGADGSHRLRSDSKKDRRIRPRHVRQFPSVR